MTKALNNQEMENNMQAVRHVIIAILLAITIIAVSNAILGQLK